MDLMLRKVTLRLSFGGQTQMVWDVEVETGELVESESGGTHLVQNVAATVGGEVDMLGEVKTVKQFQEANCTFAVRIINMDVEVAEQENWGGYGG